MQISVAAAKDVIQQALREAVTNSGGTALSAVELDFLAGVVIGRLCCRAVEEPS